MIKNPVGFALSAVENRKTIGKVVIAVVAFMLLPVIIIEMLPGVIFSGFGTGSETDNEAVEKALFEDVEVIFENFDEAVGVVDNVMVSAHDSTLQKAYRHFRSYNSEDEMIIIDNTDTDTDSYDAEKIVCDYSATTDFKSEINLDTMREKLEEETESYYSLTFSEQQDTKERLIKLDDDNYITQTYSYTIVTYTITYVGDDYIENNILGLTEEQKKLSEDYRDSLELMR